MKEHGIIISIQFECQESFTEAIYVATHEFERVDEGMQYCVMRERGKEVLAARKLGAPYIAYSFANGALEVIESNFDLDTIEKDSYRLFERRSSTHPSPIGIRSLIDDQTCGNLLEWCNILTTEDIGRKVESMTQVEFVERRDSGDIKIPFFLKSVDKGSYRNTLAMVVDTESEPTLLKSSERPDLASGAGASMYRYLSSCPDSKLTIHVPQSSYYNEWIGEDSIIPARYVSVDGRLMLSEIIDIKFDDLKSLEYRVFVVGGKVSSVSRYVDYEQTSTPDSVYEHASSFALKMRGKLPDVYVADFAETQSGIELVELNPYENSGRYLWNDPAALLTDAMSLGNEIIRPAISQHHLFYPEKRKPRLFLG